MFVRSPFSQLSCVLAILVAIFFLSYSFASAGQSNTLTVGNAKQLVAESAADTIVPPSMALAVAAITSGFRSNFENASGSRGLMSISPDVAQSYGIEPSELWDARTNISLGLRALGDFFRHFGHDWSSALQRYAKVMSVSNDPARFARRALVSERGFAEEIVTRNALEERKREVLNVKTQARYKPEFDKFFRNAFGQNEIKRQKQSFINNRTRENNNVEFSDNVYGQFKERHRTVLANLDDFSSGNIPERLLRGHKQ
ncbi:MAG: hypothetical protein CMF71_09610 [Magnetovibrio sp.]|nr:hypothetical protein [Magnetovibrio sp.]|tara:strand:- start:10929 stop:11699 length:771 start_codon:yes stop_codon:yes gene_type:complete